MRRPRPLPLVAFALVLLSGCVGGAHTKTVATTEPPEDSIVVSGRVVDDQLLPVAQADVAVLALNLTTRTDAEGGFSLAGVTPGAKELVAAKTGYLTTRVRVLAESGVNVEGLEVQLVPVAPPKVPRSVPLLGQGFISCAIKTGALTLTSVHPCEADPNHSPFFFFDVDQADGLVSVVVELAWTPTGPGLAEALRLELWNSPACSSKANCAAEFEYGLRSGRSPITWVLGNETAPFQNGIKQDGPTHMALWSHVSRDPEPLAVVVVQQQVHFYATVFYNSSPAPGYSLVPR